MIGGAEESSAAAAQGHDEGNPAFQGRSQRAESSLASDPDEGSSAPPGPEEGSAERSSHKKSCHSAAATVCRSMELKGGGVPKD